jgi:hypothetical protein
MKRPILISQQLSIPLNGGGVEVKPTAGAGERVLRVETGSAEALSDWTGLQGDMHTCIKYCDAYIVAMEEASPEVVQDALWSMALIAYARAFGSGVRNSAAFDLAGLDPSPGMALDAHEHFLSLRSKHVAHSINGLEQDPAIVVVTNDPAVAREIRLVGTVRVETNALNDDGTRFLRSLAYRFFGQASQRVEALRAQMEVELRALPVDELYAFSDFVIDVPDVEAMSGARPNRRSSRRRSNRT